MKFELQFLIIILFKWSRKNQTGIKISSKNCEKIIENYPISAYFALLSFLWISIAFIWFIRIKIKLLRHSFTKLLIRPLKYQNKQNSWWNIFHLFGDWSNVRIIWRRNVIKFEFQELGRKKINETNFYINWKAKWISKCWHGRDWSVHAEG